MPNLLTHKIIEDLLILTKKSAVTTTLDINTHWQKFLKLIEYILLASTVPTNTLPTFMNIKTFLATKKMGSLEICAQGSPWPVNTQHANHQFYIWVFWLKRNSVYYLLNFVVGEIVKQRSVHPNFQSWYSYEDWARLLFERLESSTDILLAPWP